MAVLGRGGRRRPGRPAWGGLPLLFVALGAAACDPVYCAKLHIEVRTAAGEAPPASTEVIVSRVAEPAGPAFPDTVRHTIETVETDVGGRTPPVAVCAFLNDVDDIQVDALGGTVVVWGLPLTLGNVPDYPLRVVEGQRQEYDLRLRAEP